MDTQSPLTGNIVCEPLAVYVTKQLVEDWRLMFGIEIGSELAGVSCIRKYRCPESGLFFFAPSGITGSSRLYEGLAGFDWYYPSKKWEYDECLKSLAKDLSILEVGCGSGRFLEQAQAQGHAVRGLDINPSAVETARQNGLDVTCEELHEHANECAEKYDCVCAFQILEHLANPVEFLKDALRVIKPNGQLVLATPNAESFLRYQYTLLDLPPHHVTQWSSESYRFLEKVLPVEIELISFEPLALEHVESYARSTAQHISGRFKVGARIVRSLVSKTITLVCALGLRRFFRGQCMLVVFRKRPKPKHVQTSQAEVKKYANVGCGSTWHVDWDNFDLVPSEAHIRQMDIVRDWTIPCKTYDAIYSSHVIEHLQRNQVRRFLIRCYNSLRSGGVLRIVVPDLEGICREYIRQLDAARGGDESAVRRHQWMTMELLDQVVRNRSGGAMAKLWASGDLPEEKFITERVGQEASRWMHQLREARDTDTVDVPSYETIFEQLPEVSSERAIKFRERGEIHQWMYDEVSLRSLLSSVGFQTIVRCGATESTIPRFASYNLDTDESGEVRKPDSLFIECLRP